jgi:hypothetical protein
MKKISFLVPFLCFWAVASHAQDDVISNIGIALKSSSARELVKYCHTTVEIQENGVSNTYNRPQAEIILKAFFDKNPANNFTYIHQGSSPEGYKYTIGKYSLASGSYRVYYLLKKGEDTYRIHTISFSKE